MRCRSLFIVNSQIELLISNDTCQYFGKLSSNIKSKHHSSEPKTISRIEIISEILHTITLLLDIKIDVAGCFVIIIQRITKISFEDKVNWHVKAKDFKASIRTI